MQVYVLFETDQYKSTSSRVCLGVFTSHVKADVAALENECEEGFYVIIQTTLDNFDEL